MAGGGEFSLLRDLGLVLVAAAITAVVFHKLRLPVVLGYLLAGVIVGPHVFPIPIVGDPADVALLAQLGVLFLLFSLGLDFHLGRLRRVGGLALSAGVLEVSLMVGLGFLFARLFGWSLIDALFLGAILAISSTTIIIKVHGELGRGRDGTMAAILGILLVEDLIAVLLIALLSSIALTGTVDPAGLAVLALRVAIFVVATLVIGLVVVPRAVDRVAKLGVEEILVLFAVGIAFATSVIALSLGLSVALGAFIAGAIVAESKASAIVERRIAPLRDVFAAVFFVAIGILIDPAQIVANWPAVLALSAVVIMGKIAAVGFATFVAGYPPDQALRVGLGMAMIGEFSFVIAQLGSDLGVTSGFLLPVAVGVSAVTTLLAPPLIRRSDRIVGALAHHLPERWRQQASAYTTWVERARSRAPESETRYDAGALLRALSYLAVAVAALVAARFADGWLTASFGDRIEPRLIAAAVLASTLLLLLPVMLGFLRAVRTMVDRLVHALMPPQRAPAGMALRNILYAILVVFVGVIALAVGAAFLPTIPLLLTVLTIVLITAIVLRRSLRRLDDQIGQAVDAVFKAEPAPGQRAEVMALMRDRYAWDVRVEQVIVPAGSRAAHRRIRDLQLPQRTGATLVSHERDGTQTVNPSADLVLEPGDVVGILGEQEQVDDARRLLTTETTTARPQANAGGVAMDEFDVPATSPLVGHTLAGSRLRETTGASIVGLRREGVPILNPAPVLRLKPGDTLVVLGTAAQVDAARRLVEGRA